MYLGDKLAACEPSERRSWSLKMDILRSVYARQHVEASGTQTGAAMKPDKPGSLDYCGFKTCYAKIAITCHAIR